MEDPTIASSDVGAPASTVGPITAQERIKSANDRIDIQVTLIQQHVTDLEGVDPYEATANVNALLTQIETAYALTARLQNLSLIDYI